VSPSSILGITGKLSVRRGAWALICGVSTHDVKVTKF